MANRPGERTLISAIYPPKVAHICTQYGIGFADIKITPLVAGTFASLPFDFYIKVTGKAHVNGDTISSMPLLVDSIYAKSISLRALLLNCLTKYYKQLWEKCWDPVYKEERWAKDDKRLDNNTYKRLGETWEACFGLKSDFERRQALIEIDVLTAMALGMTIDQLKTIYRIQFNVLQAYEEDTWYDINGRIVFTNNRSLTDIGFTRNEWESSIKGASDGQKFYRTIIDDTLPGGSVERTIEYVAPFTCCDREQDYETAWKFFEEKYGKKD